jgi:murein DD-endopeptidase MepM/ murein hydrolase activator NlpD
VPPSKGLLAAPKGEAASAPDAPGQAGISADDLYTSLPDNAAGVEDKNAEEEGLDAALQSLRAEVDNAFAFDARLETASVTDARTAGDRRIEASVTAGGAPAPTSDAVAGMPVRNGAFIPHAGMPTWSNASDPSAGTPPPNGTPAALADAAQDLLRTDGGMHPAGPAPTPPEAAYDKETTPGTSILSWQGPGPVSAKPRPINNFARNRKQPRTGKKNDVQARAAQQAQLRTQAQTQARMSAAPSLVPNPAFTQNAGSTAFAQNTAPDAAQTRIPAAFGMQELTDAQPSAQTRTPAPLQTQTLSAAQPLSPARAQNQSESRAQPADDAFAPPLTQPPAGILNGARKPLPGPVISRFGWEDDGTGRRRWKPGVEIAASPGEPVRAVLPGTVVYAGPRDGAGNTVVIEHNDGYRSYYGNLQPTTVRVGQRVGLGAEFAKVAAQPAAQAGGENSASLHFELKKGEMALNPESVFSRAGEARRQDARAG